MRITTIDQDTHKLCGIEEPLWSLVLSPKPLEAAYWNKLLVLVSHLQSSGSEHELRGLIVLRELQLHKVEPPDPVRDREMKKYLDECRALNPDPTTRANRLRSEMRQRFPPKPRVNVSVRVDWRDCGPLREGLPEMHYRFQVSRPGKAITEDARAKDPIEAERIISEAFGW